MDRLKLLDAGLKAFDTTLPDVVPALCVVTRYRASSCRLCLDVCPSAAIAPAGWLAIDADRCTACGACAAVCKTGALAYAARHAALRERLQEPASGGGRGLRLACRQVGEDPVSTADSALGADTSAGSAAATRVVVPCLGGVAAADLVAAAALGFASVELLRGDCVSCVDAAAGAALEATATVAAETLSALGATLAISRRSAPSRPMPGAHAAEAPAMSRAGLFSYIAQGLRRSAVEGMASDKRGVAELHRQAPPPAARGRLVADLDRLREPSQRGGEAATTSRGDAVAGRTGSVGGSSSLPAALPLGEVTVGAACDLCGLCVRYCPHGTLSLDEGGLVVDRETCSGCGLCAEVCPPAALVVRPASLPT